MRTLKLLSLVVVSFFIALHGAYCQQVEKESNAHTKFLLYTPPGYNPAVASPLLISLHGGHEIGNDLTLLTSHTEHLIPSKLIDLEGKDKSESGFWPSGRPFIVLSPQLKKDNSIININDQEWPATLVDEVVEYVRAKYNVDANRIYLTGISLGAAGGWDYLAAYPNKIAAFVPISGKTRLENACLVKNIPIWGFHGENDALVRPAFSVDMFKAVNECSAGAYKQKLNLLHVKGHEGWSEVYNGTHGYDVFDWLLQFEKNNSSNKAPYVNAGPDQKILLRNESYHLASDYFDFDGIVSSTGWVKISGPDVTLDQTNPKLLKLSNLSVGTYELELQVTDNLGMQRNDRVSIEVLNSIPPAEPAVTQLMLTSGGGDNKDIGPLSDGLIINTAELGTNFNIRAVVNGTTASVRFKVNTNQNTSTTNNPGPFYIKKLGTSWEIPNGEYVVTATPYRQTGARGSAGISLSFKITVTDHIIVINNYYAKSNVDLSLTSSWGSNTDGSGTAPSSFTANDQTFNIRNAAILTNSLTVSGSSSALWIRTGGSLTIGNKLTSLNTEANTTITVNTAQAITYGMLHPSTSFIFAENAVNIPTRQYANVTLKGAGTTKNLSAGATQISGDLTIEGNVSLNGNASLLTLSGNWINNGTFTPGTSIVTLNGTNSQSISGANSFNKLVVSKSTGNITLSGTGSSTITNLLTLTSGYIVTASSHKLILTSAATISGASSNSFIDGALEKNLNANGTFNFPMGNVAASLYRPVALENTSAADTWTGRYINRDPGSDGYTRSLLNTTSITSVSQWEYWDISRAGTAAATLTLSFGPGSYNSPSIGETAKLRIAHWNGSQWDLPTGNGAITKKGDETSGSITLTNVTSFSPFTIGSYEIPMSVVWSAFVANRVAHAVVLRWSTVMEYNNNRFEVERSVDGYVFNTLTTKPAAGNSSTLNHYEFIDQEVSDNTTYYYRIRQIDNDGKFEFSKVIALPETGRNYTRWMAYPNPINEQQHFNIILNDKSIDANHPFKVKVISANGSILFTSYGSLKDINQELENLHHNFSAGLYIIELTDGAYSEHLRIARY